ncbi:MAG TPA: isoleucine--tRNA ligase, partial [Prolixibacteraceae bacterium]|nr:isoleucine--tRNA ligase [Prolixibacteraceae bacterium]
MNDKFQEYKQLDLHQINREVRRRWEEEDTFHQSIRSREGRPTFVFYEGPPSANGMPGIHHVMARAIKDIFCRYKTMKGYMVHRKAGWDTHGLPVELGVEKALGITKEDIGKKISIEDFNKACRHDVMRYTREWEELTREMGYWVNMDDPYVTYDTRYMESVWWLLRQIYDKGLLYKGYSIQPYSPAAGTGLSSHELNQPGCYRDVKDTTAVAQFKLIRNNASEDLFRDIDTDLYILAWTTTPWTLPSNTALCVGPAITYVKVSTFNPYSGLPVTLILAKDLLASYFDPAMEGADPAGYEAGSKKIPWRILSEFPGETLKGLDYEQLIGWVKPAGQAFKVITGDFVTTEDGTGIVHIAPTFGADDYRVARQFGISPLTVVDSEGKIQPLVDRKGRFYPVENLEASFVQQFVDQVSYAPFAGKFVKNEYDASIPEYEPTTDVDIAVMLKQENKVFRIEKMVHSYPHCWRTDKPVLYYPMDAWFIRTTAVKDKLIELNNTINWKPKSTGTGRFGNWLENLVDWNLSRSRYWGTPLPIWRTEDGSEEKCIGSAQELINEIGKSIQAGFMEKNPYEGFQPEMFTKENYEKLDLHKPYVDDIVLVSPSGKRMFREPDLIDVWFDSGAMPYAQHHYPFSLPPTPSSGGGVVKEGVWKLADPMNYGLLKEKVKELKKFSTEAEALLWTALRGKRLDGFKFRRQHIIDRFIVDFSCLAKQIIIEADGPIHDLPENKIADEERTQILNGLGFKILRFSNNEVLGNLEGVLSKILHELNKPSSPSPEGRVGVGLFPADFIAEGVDQTRGWFFTLHAIATMVSESVAFRNIISNGLVLDKNGNKMSKRLGNAVDPFQTIEEYGADAVRWYMITNSQPWDNLKFDVTGVDEVRRKFFGTLYNTYSFFALYANVDQFRFAEPEIPVAERPELDRWILSLLNTLIAGVNDGYENYEPTKAGRAIQDFVSENLSNWFVRLSRKRYWGGAFDKDKISAYQTLYTCLSTVAKLMAPIAPFYADLLYTDLNRVTNKDTDQSVHLADFPVPDWSLIDKDLEEKMDIAQKASSMILSLRRKEKIRVRQPLAKIMVPVLNEKFREQFEAVKNIVLTEVNVKEIEFLKDSSGIIHKKIKPNFKVLGPKYGKLMKEISAALGKFSQEEISALEQSGRYEFNIGSEQVVILPEDVEISSEDIPGWLVATEGNLTIALDIHITEALKMEGIAREFINKIQNIRKESDFQVTDRITVKIGKHPLLDNAVLAHRDYISAQTLAAGLELVSGLTNGDARMVEIEQGVETLVWVEKYTR